ncbi:MAG: hypothetical protein ACREJB_16950, partial [Planctomycetaceae bacterium]
PYTESFGSLEVLRFQYLYLGLPRLDAVEYMETGNDFSAALVGLMKVPEDLALTVRANALERVAESGYDQQRRFLLAECIEEPES